MTRLQRVVPWFVAVLCLVYLATLMVRSGTNAGATPEAAAYDWNQAGRIPISADGRVKPLDTFARNSLLMLSGRQTFDTGGGRQGPAIQWLIELLASPSAAGDRPIFRIDHPDVVAMLNLKADGRTRFTLRDMDPRLDEFAVQADKAAQVPPKQRDPFQRQISDLENKLSLYSAIARLQTPYTVAPLAPGEEWRSLAALQQGPATDHASAKVFESMRTAYAAKNPEAFNQAVHAYISTIEAKLPADLHKAGYEVVFNRIEPFHQAATLYVGTFLLACVGFLLGTMSNPGWFRTLSRAALSVLLIAFCVHTIGIASRIYLQGRPPVTNLYSSAVFIGWACIPLALVAERMFRLGIGMIVASLVGFATLIVAHNLSSGGDTMEMMQAVLDSNFWLATHVVVVTIGYSATFLAGFLGAAYILFGVLTPWLKGESAVALPKMTYGMICFAAITSFVGTVLGGIWADQSWGRFWGWDPKENGAALIVFMNLLTLHARWGGMVRERGVAVLAVGGGIVTAWSWFGTNMLGVGLHSYGFMESAVFWLVGFCLSQLAIMAIGLVPQRLWWSSRRTQAADQRRTTPSRAKITRQPAV